MYHNFLLPCYLQKTLFRPHLQIHQKEHIDALVNDLKHQSSHTGSNV